MKQIGTDMGMIEGEYYLDPWTEMSEYIMPIFYLVARHTILSCAVCWSMWAYENRN